MVRPLAFTAAVATAAMVPNGQNMRIMIQTPAATRHALTATESKAAMGRGSSVRDRGFRTLTMRGISRATSKCRSIY